MENDVHFINDSWRYVILRFITHWKEGIKPKKAEEINHLSIPAAILKFSLAFLQDSDQERFVVSGMKILMWRDIRSV